jgi:valyl-tRNA synthetase
MGSTEAPENLHRGDLPKAYSPAEIEQKWYDFWLAGNYFHADAADDRPPYTIVIPPPNVTGALHVGHGLVNTLQDVLIRWARMRGNATLWVPGTDHAGIATQHVVAEHLRSRGIEPREIGREKFLEHIWQWKEQYGGTIIDQLKRLGCSCDWEREVFTLDDARQKAVRVAFKRLYDKGLIYRGNYLVNWDPVDRTALSDDEVDYEDEEGALWHLRYPYEDGSGHAVVATTRPETMLGDTAVAVNPTDERYKHLVGKHVILPLVNRRIPIIADDFVPDGPSPQSRTGQHSHRRCKD